MDPINIIIGFNIIATFGANFSSAKKGVKDKVGVFKDKPQTYLQSLPLALSSISLIVLIISLFQIGTLEYNPQYNSIRIAGMIVYIVFSWVQIWATKSLGDNFSQYIAIKKEHKLITSGAYRFVRHPQYISQFLLDAGGAMATLSFILAPLALLQLPFLVMRALLEDKLLQKHFSDSFNEFKKKTGLMLPFVG